MEENGDTPPFWAQPTAVPRRRSSPPLSLPILIMILPLITLILLFFVLPPFLSVTSQILRPQTVKRSWDTFNILLVLFAILCGVFARTNDDGSAPADDGNSAVPTVPKRNDERPAVANKWFDEYSSNRKIYDSPIRAEPATGVSRLRRSSSSYPDLRQESLWEAQASDDRFRFFDDFEINKYSSPAPPEYRRLRRTRTEIEEYSDIKVIPVDTCVIRSSTHPFPPPPPPSKSPLTPPPPESPATPPPPPPPPPPAVRHKTRRTYQSVRRREKPETGSQREAEFEKNHSPAPTPPPPPPPPPPVQSVHDSEQSQKQGKLERRKSNAKKEIAMVLASLYNQRKRGKKKQKAKNVRENASGSPPEEPHLSTTIPPPSPAPPPPPLPPPPSVFHSLFKKGISKSKKIHSVPVPPPPPPPAPISSKRRTQTQIPPAPPPAPPTFPPPTPPRSSRRRNSTSGRPPLPTKVNSYYYDRDDNVNSGGQSPLIPPPPPPPPFRVADMKFVVSGDFVRVKSTQSSRCSSPELETVDQSSNKDASRVTDGGDSSGPVFCPSPDVNMKADSFIARLRDEWRLEKMNSLREKKDMGQGPGTGPGPVSRPAYKYSV